MYSKDQRDTAIELYIKYNKRVAPVIRELGYPDRRMIKKWYLEHLDAQKGIIKSNTRKPFFSKEQRDLAVKHYLDHGKNISEMVRQLGYPSRTILSRWLNEDVPHHKVSCLTGRPLVTFTQKEKEDAIIDLSLRNSTAIEIAKLHNVSTVSIYNWRRKHLSSKGMQIMNKKSKGNKEAVGQLSNEIIELQNQIYKLHLEKDILEQAIKLIKKEIGIDIHLLSNYEKTIIINALREQYPLNMLLDALALPKSSYCYQNNVLRRVDKYFLVRQRLKEIFLTNYESYGSERMYRELKKVDIHISEKVVRRLMKEENLIIRYVKKKKYSSYLGEISPAVENIVKRDLSAIKPNTKMLTDISEFAIPAGKIYLSPLIDCFDGLIASWSIGTSPNAEMVNTMLTEYVSTLKYGESPIIHSDRGSHYRWPQWIEIMDSASLTRSMSKKGCSPDNSACEGFFGRLKNEMFYNRDWKNVSIESFIQQLNDYIKWYNNDRIKISLGGMSPVEYRLHLRKD